MPVMLIFILFSCLLLICKSYDVIVNNDDGSTIISENPGFISDISDNITNNQDDNIFSDASISKVITDNYIELDGTININIIEQNVDLIDKQIDKNSNIEENVDFENIDISHDSIVIEEQIHNEININIISIQSETISSIDITETIALEDISKDQEPKESNEFEKFDIHQDSFVIGENLVSIQSGAIPRIEIAETITKEDIVLSNDQESNILVPLTYEELYDKYITILNNNLLLNDELKILKNMIYTSNKDYENANQERNQLKENQLQTNVLVENLTNTKDKCFLNNIQLSNEIKTLTSELLESKSNTCNNHHDYQQCRSLLATTIHENDELVNTLTNITTLYNNVNKKVAIYDNKINLIKNEQTISKLLYENCIIEKNIILDEWNDIPANNCNSSHHLSNNATNVCYELLFEKSNVYIKKSVHLWNNYMVPVISYVWSVFIYLLNHLISLYNNHILPYYNNTIVTTVQSHPLTNVIYQWYLDNISLYVVLYFEPIYDYIVRKVNVIFYYIITYYNNEDLHIHLYNNLIDITTKISNFLSNIISNYISNSTFVDNNLDSIIFYTVITIIVYLCYKLKKYIFGILAGLCMILISPIILFVYLFIELPKKYLMNRKKIKIRKRVVRRIISNNNESISNSTNRYIDSNNNSINSNYDSPNRQSNVDVDYNINLSTPTTNKYIV